MLLHGVCTGLALNQQPAVFRRDQLQFHHKGKRQLNRIVNGKLQRSQPRLFAELIDADKQTCIADRGPG